MGKPAARLTDMHTCPMWSGNTPHVGGPIIAPCKPTVLIGGLAAARVTDPAICNGPTDTIVQGSATVRIGGLQAARLGDATAHGGVIVAGHPRVLIGDGAGGGQQQSEGMPAGGGSGSSAAGQPPSSPSATNATPGSALAAAAQAVNPSNSNVNCGNIIDAVVARLRGTNSKATASASRDGSFSQIEQRFNTRIQWGSSFQGAFNSVAKGGNGTVAVVGMTNPATGFSHVVILANDHGTVGIVEGQNWGPGQPKGVITDPATANARYNADGHSTIGYGLVP